MKGVKWVHTANCSLLSSFSCLAVIKTSILDTPFQVPLQVSLRRDVIRKVNNHRWRSHVRRRRNWRKYRSGKAVQLYGRRPNRLAYKKRGKHYGGYWSAVTDFRRVSRGISKLFGTKVGTVQEGILPLTFACPAFLIIWYLLDRASLI